MEFKKGMVCPVCESGSLGDKYEEVKFDYKGLPLIFPSEKVYACDRCGESFFDPKRNREIERELSDHRRQVDGFLTSEEIRCIREIYSMTQIEFAKLFGVGEKNFARYESGQATQGRSMDNLLRVLRERPEVVSLFSRGYKNEVAKKTGLTQVIQYSSRLPKWIFRTEQEADSYSDSPTVVSYA